MSEVTLIDQNKVSLHPMCCPFVRRNLSIAIVQASLTFWYILDGVAEDPAMSSMMRSTWCNLSP